MDALIAYAKAWDIELLYDHYQVNFYQYLDENYGFKFPFELELATTYYDKIVLSKDKENRDRHYNMAGTNISVYQVLERVIKYGKKVEFLDPEITLEVIKSRVDNNYDIYQQYALTNGNAAYDRDFSFGSYDIKFVD